MAQKYDYSQLEDILSQSNWEEADQVTTDLILVIANDAYRSSITFNPKDYDPNYLTEKSIRALPIKELKKIDSLWQKYSDGKFGFTPQAEIWRKCGAPLNLLSASIMSNEKSSNQILAEVFLKSLGWYSVNSSNYPAGAFPFTYGLKTKGNEGFLDSRLKPFGWIVMLIGLFIGLGIASTMSDIKFVVFLIAAGVGSLFAAFVSALGLNNQIWYKSQSWLVVLSRFSK